MGAGHEADDPHHLGWHERAAASLDWKKKSAAAAFYANGARGILGTTCNQFMFTHPDQQKQEYIADSGYFADGTSLVGAGNALFRPPMPDPHTPNSPLPESKYIVDAGYFADGTSLSGPVTPSSGRP